MRSIGLDVHRDFCEVAIAERGNVRSAGRIKTRVETLELFAESLGPDDAVALEATSGATKIAALIEPHGVLAVAPTLLVVSDDRRSADDRRPHAQTQPRGSASRARES